MSGVWGPLWLYIRDTAGADVKAAVDLQKELKQGAARALTMEEDTSSGLRRPQR
jgi:hypothetical protein